MHPQNALIYFINVCLFVFFVYMLGYITQKELSTHTLKGKCTLSDDDFDSLVKGYGDIFGVALGVSNHVKVKKPWTRE